MTGAHVAERTARHGREVLEQTGVPPGAMAGLFAVNGTADDVRLAAMTANGCDASPDLLELGALAALRSGKRTAVDALPSQLGATAAPGLGQLAVPIRLEEGPAAVVVLLAQPLELPAWESRLEPSRLTLGLLADRLRSFLALEQRGEEITALRQQLDVYAVDFRSTYLAEQSRARQLADALSELEHTYRATVRGLAIAVEAKDECTGGHIHRVCRYGMMLTRLVAPEHADDPQFEYGFLLHDIGKLTVPDEILRKPGSLDELEWVMMRSHPDSGYSILEDIPFLGEARKIVHAHHERWDGNGYPRRLAEEEIPLGAQIFPICDAFDAMTSDRPYRAAMGIGDALSELRRGAGKQFRPDAVEAFLSLPLDELDAVRRQRGEEGSP
ncbi:MAG TPA: HD-GYP domain-containing protein [Acidimicrobiales bacterium]|nr:HD-GYP domain-containing protein [Acidimicrobiales bacterium]